MLGIRTSSLKPLSSLIPRSAQGILRQKANPRPQILAPRPLWKLLIIIGFSRLVNSKVDSAAQDGISPLCTATCGLARREHVPDRTFVHTPGEPLSPSR